MKNELRDVLELLDKATPGEAVGHMRRDDSIFVSIGNPRDGAHAQGDVHLPYEDVAAMVAAVNFLRKHGPALSAEPDSDGERLSDAACDAIARALDAHGRDKLGYEGGLPAWDEECFIVMRHLIRDAARSAAQEK